MDMLKVSGFLHVIVALLLILKLPFATPTLISPNKTYVSYIKTSCNITTYPELCYKSLCVFASKIKTSPKVLAHTALNVTLAAAKTTSLVLNKLSKTQGLNPAESAALSDCVELVDDSSYELRRSLKEMRRLRNDNEFVLGISNILTWTSAALTNCVTCTDGFEGINNNDGMNINEDIKNTVLRHEKKVSRLTSNSLALVNNYASSQG